MLVADSASRVWPKVCSFPSVPSPLPGSVVLSSGAAWKEHLGHDWLIKVYNQCLHCITLLPTACHSNGDDCSLWIAASDWLERAAVTLCRRFAMRFSLHCIEFSISGAPEIDFHLKKASVSYAIVYEQSRCVLVMSLPVIMSVQLPI